MGDKSDKPKPVIRKRTPRRGVSRKPENTQTKPREEPKGYDPELLYVECGRCGSPVLWEPGRATALLTHAGVDPLEIDASCLLVTDACPACGAADEYSVRICRISDRHPNEMPPTHGNA